MKQALAVLLFLALAACGGPKTGPEPVHYDRDVCEQCRMIISDPHFVTEVRTKDGVLHHFDDPGGAVIWMDEHQVNPALSEVWVMDVRDGKTWLDAHTAWFVKAQTTPMDYGYGALAEKRQGAISFSDFVHLIRARKGRQPEPGS